MRFVLSMLALVAFVPLAEAGPLRDRLARNRAPAPSYQHSSYTAASPAGYYHAESTAISGGAWDALAEVNAARAARGLRPFLPDPNLTVAAERAAAVRAASLIAGHTANDFQFLPPGTGAAAAGCGALEPSWGFQACCQWESWTYAGAATVRGRDGKLYHHLFVR